MYCFRMMQHDSIPNGWRVEISVQASILFFFFDKNKINTLPNIKAALFISEFWRVCGNSM